MKHSLLLTCVATAALSFSNLAQAACNPNLPRETPDSDFVVNAGGHTVTHTRPGLTWRRCQLGMNWNGSTCTGTAQSMIWQTALLTVEAINTGTGLDGHRDWRVPDLNELMTLVDHACYDPAINTNRFPNTAYPSAHIARYWSSTPDGSNGWAWSLDFQFGMIVADTMASTSLRVRPVRGTLRGTPGATPPPSLPVFVENFDTLESTHANKWITGNFSEPEGERTWLLFDTFYFNAQAGAPESFVSTTFQATGGNGTISDWLVTPLLDFRPGSSLSFHTRTITDAVYADRLQVRLCTGEPCNTAGPGALGVGGFTTLLLDINPNLLPGPDASGVNGYPDVWTSFQLGAAQGIPSSGRGRIAFRYFVPDGGTFGSHSYVIGLDTIRIEATPILD